jgi:hypothetical protein
VITLGFALIAGCVLAAFIRTPDSGHISER